MVNGATGYTIISISQKLSDWKELLFNFVLHHSHSFTLGVLKLQGGAAKITQNIVSSVMKEDVFHLQRETDTTGDILKTQITLR